MNIAEASAHHVVMDASDDVSGCTGVAHVTFDVTQGFVDRLRKAQYLCSRHHFTQIRSEYTPTQWSDAEGQAIHQAGLDTPLPVADTALVVTPTTFWVRGATSDGAVLKSEMIDIAAFMEEQKSLNASLESGGFAH